MLATTLATVFAPGTNIEGDVAGANWTFLLPTLELERIVPTLTNIAGGYRRPAITALGRCCSSYSTARAGRRSTSSS